MRCQLVTLNHHSVTLLSGVQWECFDGLVVVLVLASLVCSNFLGSVHRIIISVISTEIATAILFGLDFGLRDIAMEWNLFFLAGVLDTPLPRNRLLLFQRSRNIPRNEGWWFDCGMDDLFVAWRGGGGCSIDVGGLDFCFWGEGSIDLKIFLILSNFLFLLLGCVIYIFIFIFFFTILRNFQISIIIFWVGWRRSLLNFVLELFFAKIGWFIVVRWAPTLTVDWLSQTVAVCKLVNIVQLLALGRWLFGFIFFLTQILVGLWWVLLLLTSCSTGLKLKIVLRLKVFLVTSVLVVLLLLAYFEACVLLGCGDGVFDALYRSSLVAIIRWSWVVTLRLSFVLVLSLR